MDETNGSGSSTKSDSAHRIEVVRGPRRTLIRLTGSFLVLLTPAVARTPSPPQLAYLSSPTGRRPRFLPPPNVRAANILGTVAIPSTFYFFGYFVAAERLDFGLFA